MGTVGHPLVFAVGILGNILSFLVTLAPVPTFYRVYKKKSTESFQSVPYVVALLSAMLWLYYALLAKDFLLLSINAIACVVQSVYITIYVVYAPKEAMAFTVKLLCTMNVALYGGMVAFLQFYVEGRRRVSVAGGIGAAFAFAVFVAPLAIIRQVVRTKSVEFMPFWLSFFLTLSAVVWFLYGLLVKDFFVAMPNVLGLLFGLAQMALYFMYRNPKKNGAVSEIQVAQQQAADEISKDQQQQEADEDSKDQQQLQQTYRAADGEAAATISDADIEEAAGKNDDVVVDILPSHPPPSLSRPPPVVAQTPIEVV